MLSYVIFCYVAELLISALPIFLYFILKKKIKRVKPFSFMAGMLFFAAFMIGALALIGYLNANMSYIMTKSLKILIVFGSVGLIFILRYIVYNVFLFDKDKTKTARSFSAGFGFGGALVNILFALVMIVIVISALISSKYVGFDNAMGALKFENGSNVVVFQPLFGHISFSVCAILFIIEELLVYKIFKTLYYKRIKTIYIFTLNLITGIIQTTFVSLIISISFLSYSNVILSIMLLGLLILTVFINYISNKIKEKSTEEYIKQF